MDLRPPLRRLHFAIACHGTPQTTVKSPFMDALSALRHPWHFSLPVRAQLEPVATPRTGYVHPLRYRSLEAEPERRDRLLYYRSVPAYTNAVYFMVPVCSTGRLVTPKLDIGIT